MYKSIALCTEHILKKMPLRQIGKAMISYFLETPDSFTDHTKAGSLAVKVAKNISTTSKYFETH